MGIIDDEIKGNSTCRQKDYARIRSQRWNIRGNRTNVQYIAIMSMVFSILSIIFYVYKVAQSTTTSGAVAFQSLTIAVFLAQLISAVILLVGIAKGRSHTQFHFSTRFWSGVSRFQIVFHTVSISIHFFLWTITTAKTLYAFYVSLISAFIVIFLAVGVHYVKLFVIEVDINEDVCLKEVQNCQ